MSHMLTATNFIASRGSGFDAEGYAGGISVDQEIANQLHALAGPTAASPFKSLAFSVQANNSYWGTRTYARMSYAGPNQPITPEDSPRAMYQRLFANRSSSQDDGGAFKSLIARRRSVLDLVGEDLRRLQVQLGSVDRRRLERHAAALRQVEQRLAALAVAPSGTACKAPNAAAINAASSFPAVGRAHMDLIALALACDLTRVATLQWSHAQSALTPSWAGISMSSGYPSYHHGISHEGDGNASAQEDFKRISAWYAGQLGYLADRLDEIREPAGGTLLDSAAVLWCTEISKGNTHSYANMPFVVLGSAGGALRAGEHVKLAPSVPHNNLFLTLIQAMGGRATAFGNPKYSSGVLAALLT
jgi:hypothetical protein